MNQVPDPFKTYAECAEPESLTAANDAYRIQVLERENAKLRQAIKSLVEALA